MNKDRAREVIDRLRRKIQTEVCGCENRLKNEVDVDRIQQCKTEIILLQERLQALDIAIESLDNEWVDVRDRLPSESGVYLVTRDKGGWSVMGNEVDRNYFDKDNEKWFVDIMRETDITYQVIAWQVVEPYERKE